MRLFLIIGYILLLVEVLVADNKTSKIDYGKLEGNIRLYNIFYPAYVKSGRKNDYKLNGSTIGGHIRYHSPVISNIGISTAVYYARGTGLNDINDKDTIVAAGRFFTADYSPKAVLGELNIHYEDKIHYAIIGNYKINSPLTNSVKTYMPNMFQAILYKNSALKDTQITIAHISKMAYGTRTPVEFGIIGEATMTAGATQNAINTRGKFIDIEKQTLDDPNAKTNGITVFAIENQSIKNIKLRFWDFYAYDILNMFYLDLVYSNKTNTFAYNLSFEYLRTDSVGKNLASKWMDSNSAYLFGVKGTIKYKKVFMYLAFNHSGSSRIVNPWGGDPAYTSSYFSRNAYRADVDAYKIGFNYDIFKNLKLITYYANYGKSTTPGTFSPAKPVQLSLKLAEGNAMEEALLFKYKIIRNLTILGGLFYKTSEYFYAGKQVKILDVDMAITYEF